MHFKEQLEKDEVISSIISISKDEDTKYLVFATKKGLIKKTLLSEFENIRTSGKICINLKNNDELIGVKKTNGENMILLGTNLGRMVKFNESEIRCMGRTASGVKGVHLDEQSYCVCCEVVNEEDIILIVTENGYGKQNKVADFRATRRGSKGVKALNITEKNGIIVEVKVVHNQNELVIMTNSGMTMRMPINQINIMGRIMLIHSNIYWHYYYFFNYSKICFRYN